MEIPILLGANPKIANPVEWIPIRFDRWTVRVEGLVDSSLILHLYRQDTTNLPLSYIDKSKLNGEIFNGPIQVRVEFKERGTEKSITIFAVEHK